MCGSYLFLTLVGLTHTLKGVSLRPLICQYNIKCHLFFSFLNGHCNLIGCANGSWFALRYSNRILNTCFSFLTLGTIYGFSRREMRLLLFRHFLWVGLFRHRRGFHGLAWHRRLIRHGREFLFRERHSQEHPAYKTLKNQSLAIGVDVA